MLPDLRKAEKRTGQKEKKEKYDGKWEGKKSEKKRERSDAPLQKSLNFMWEWQPFVLLNWIQKVWLTAALLKARAWLTIRRLQNETEAKLGESGCVWVCVCLCNDELYSGTDTKRETWYQLQLASCYVVLKVCIGNQISAAQQGRYS